MATEQDEFVMDYPIHPGTILAEELDARDMSRADLARHMGRPARLVSELLAGRRAVTAEIALDLEAALQVPAQFWVDLQGTYELTSARVKRSQLTA